MKYISLITIVLLGIFSTKLIAQTKQTKRDYVNISFESLPKDTYTNFFKGQTTERVLTDPEYFVWCTSVIKWKGKYHAYYSRWNRKHGFKGWMTNSEIAHAVASKPEGPFKFVNVVLEEKKITGWDSFTSHNPYAVVANGKICLYYCGIDAQSLLKKDNRTIQNADSLWFEQNRNAIRNSQSIGVAFANDPSGPFVRNEEPIVSPDNVKFKNIAVNPAVVYRDNKYVMIMKGDEVSKEKWFRIQLVGEADKPNGPFIFQEKPVYDKEQTEDACVWYDTVLMKYYMVCHVMGKNELSLFNSEDGINWQPDPRKIFMKKEILLSDGTIWKPERVERPFVVTDRTGKPLILYVAVADKNRSGNIAIPIKWEN